MNPSLLADIRGDESAHFDARLRGWLNNALAEGAIKTFADALAASRGAFPDVVAKALFAIGLGHLVHEHGDNGIQQQTLGPELHAADYEWYFTENVARALADDVLGPQPVLAFGAPTVADAHREPRRETVLVDRSPFVQARFPGLVVWPHDLTMRGVFGLWPRVVFDPPWYLDATLDWLAHAAMAITPGGLIAFALYPEGTRATATVERTLILEAAQSLGRVQVYDRVVAYSTPRFEHEALKELGLPAPKNWRVGDLVTVEVHRPRPHGLGPLRWREPSTWRSWVLPGGLTATLKTRSRPGTKVLAVPDLGGWVLPTVRRSSRRQHDFDLWTSGNRVARVGDPALVGAYLTRLSSRLTVDEACAPLVIQEQHQAGIGALVDILELRS